jgi:hypothetical protein
MEKKYPIVDMILPADKVAFMQEAIENLRSSNRSDYESGDFDIYNHKQESRYKSFEEILQWLSPVQPPAEAYRGQEANDQIIANQMAGMSLEEATYQAGYTAGVDFERNRRGQQGAVWVKANEYKTDKPIFRPYRRKSVHEGVDYDFGEIFIEPQDDGQLYLDVDSENNYMPQSHERWNDYDILDESGEKEVTNG